MYNAVIFTAYAVTNTTISIHDKCNPIESKTPASDETGVPFGLVARIRLRLNHALLWIRNFSDLFNEQYTKG
jgi:hypothetical protein